jgi:hypothetical protein
MEVDTTQLIDQIFNQPPMPKRAITLSFVEDMNLIDLFEFLLTVFTEGGKKLYGDTEGKINLDMCTDTELDVINKYCQSIGFKFIMDKYDPGDAQYIDFNAMYYKNIKITERTLLKELHLTMHCKKNIYVLTFDYC